MALRSPVRHEIGSRFAWLLKNAEMKGRDLAAALGTTDKGIATKLGKGESLTIERVVELANLMAGEGQLVEDPKALFDFMVWGGEVASVLRPHLRLVDGSDQPTESKWVARESNPEPTDRWSVAPEIRLVA